MCGLYVVYGVKLLKLHRAVALFKLTLSIKTADTICMLEEVVLYLQMSSAAFIKDRFLLFGKVADCFHYRKRLPVCQQKIAKI